MEDTMARTAASTTRKTPAKTTPTPAETAPETAPEAAPETAPEAAPETAPEATAETAAETALAEAIEETAAEVEDAVSGDELEAALESAEGDPIITFEPLDAPTGAETKPEAPAESAPAASTAPLEPPAPPAPQEPPAPAAATPETLGAKAAATGARRTVAVFDDETGAQLGMGDIDGLFVPVAQGATVVVSTRRLLQEVVLPPYDDTTRVLLVPKGATMPVADAEVIEALIALTAEG